MVAYFILLEYFQDLVTFSKTDESTTGTTGAQAQDSKGGNDANNVSIRGRFANMDSKDIMDEYNKTRRRSSCKDITLQVKLMFYKVYCYLGFTNVMFKMFHRQGNRAYSNIR